MPGFAKVISCCCIRDCSRNAITLLFFSGNFCLGFICSLQALLKTLTSEFLNNRNHCIGTVSKTCNHCCPVILLRDDTQPLLTICCVVQPQGAVDHFISSLVNADIDLDGSCNGTVDGSATYYSPVIHTTTIGPLQPGVTYFYRVSNIAMLGLNEQMNFQIFKRTMEG